MVVVIIIMVEFHTDSGAVVAVVLVVVQCWCSLSILSIPTTPPCKIREHGDTSADVCACVCNTQTHAYACTHT